MLSTDEDDNNNKNPKQNSLRSCEKKPQDKNRNRYSSYIGSSIYSSISQRRLWVRMTCWDFLSQKHRTNTEKFQLCQWQSSGKGKKYTVQYKLWCAHTCSFSLSLTNYLNLMPGLWIRKLQFAVYANSWGGCTLRRLHSAKKNNRGCKFLSETSEVVEINCGFQLFTLHNWWVIADAAPYHT